MNASQLKYIYILLLTTIALSLSAQRKSKEVSVEWSDEKKMSRRSTLSGIVGKNANGIYALKLEEKVLASSEFTIEHYDNNMKLLKSSEFVLKEGKKLKNYEGSIMSNGKLFVFSSFNNRGKGKSFFFIQTINLKTLKLNNDLRKIAEAEYKNTQKRNASNFFYNVSRDSSKVLVYFNVLQKKKEKEKYGFYVFDADMNSLYSKKTTLPYKSDLFEVQFFKVDNNGNMHILGKIFKEKRRNKRNGKPNYSYQVLSYYDQGETLKKYDIKIKDKYLNDMQIAIDKNGDIACGGFYSSSASFKVDGTFWLKIDHKTKAVISENFKEFDIDFITQNMKKRKEKKAKRKEKKGKDVELFSYALDDIIFNNDGGAVLIGEQFFIKVSTTTDAQGRSRSTVYYNYHDIVVIKISKDGNIDWAEKIPKRQTSANDGGFYSSYYLSVVKNKLYFIFNDNPKNLFNEGDGKLKNYILNKECLVVLVTMNAKGEQKKEALFETRESETYIRPKVGKQVGFRETILFGQKRKKQKLAKLTFK